MNLCSMFVFFVDYCPNKTITIRRDEYVDIKSPFFPTYYPDNTNCYWVITRGQLPGYLVITFLTVSLHHVGDYLIIGIGYNIGDRSIFRLSGSAAPRIATVNDSTVWLHFETDRVGQGAAFGFNLGFQRQDTYGKWNIDHSIVPTSSLGRLHKREYAVYKFFIVNHWTMTTSGQMWPWFS